MFSAGRRSAPAIVVDDASVLVGRAGIEPVAAPAEPATASAAQLEWQRVVSAPLP